MDKRVKIGISSLGVLLIAGLLVFILWPKPDHGVRKLTFGTFAKSIGNAPYHVAKHFKWFEEHPDLKASRSPT